MATVIRRIYFFITLLSGTFLIPPAEAQYVNPNVTWSTATKKISDTEFNIILKATISPGFHLYSQFIGDGGPIPTSFAFEKSSDYKTEGKVKEAGNRHEQVEPLFDNMKLIWFEDNVTFTQQVKILKPEVTIKGSVNFMTCNDKMCDPPSDHAFEFKLRGNSDTGNAPDLQKKSSVQMSSSLIKAPNTNPNVRWTVSTQQISDDQFSIAMKAAIAPGYHLYSQFVTDSVPVATSFSFGKSNDYKLIGRVEESGNRHEALEPLFDNARLIWYQDNATFTQQVKILKDQVTIMDTVGFTTCNDKMCDLRNIQIFEINLKGNAASKNLNHSTASAASVPLSSSVKDSSVAKVGPADGNGQDNSDVRNMSGLATFLKGFGLGLVALTFPCVWPVIPLTVSYFLKSESRKKKGRMNAIIYALSIVIIFVLLGVLVSLLTNGQKLNELSTGWFFNILFFILFFLFGLSFLGVFEFRIPSGLINRSEAMSERGGLIGIFFMAFTLVLVSFSCTLPFIGNLIDIVSRDKSFAKPVIGFSAFGLALGLPFGILAMFPSALHRLPKSGHWMHVLKVTFGFLEIALSMIYLSKVDMAYHWGVLSRDIFLAVWIVLSFVLGLYLLNKIKLTAEDDDKHISVGRLLAAIFFLAFALYMIPGLWGSPLIPLSGFLPNYSEFSLATYKEGGVDGNGAVTQQENKNTSAENSSSDKKYGNLFQAPLGLNLYFDYDDALAHAQAEHKPLFIDFTGWGCVNCRKMEKSVWPDPQVLARLKNDYVAASLYVDDRTPLPDKEKYFSKKLNKEIETLGDKNFDLQYSKFDMGAQPYYVLLDDQANLLTQPRGYTPDPLEYTKFLDDGLKAFRKEQVAELK